jgi:hypothetical protein
MHVVSRRLCLPGFCIRYNNSIFIKIKENKSLKSSLMLHKNYIEIIILLHHPPRYLMTAQITIQIFRASACSKKCRKRGIRQLG